MTHRILTPEHIRAFRNHLLEEEKAPATLDKYLRDVRAFASFAAGRPMTKELVMDWKARLVFRGYAPRSINSMLASLSSFLIYMGWGDCRVKSLKLQRRVYCPEEKELTKGEYRRLLSAADQRMSLVMQTICATGIRVSELRFFTWEAVTRGEVVVRCKAKTRAILLPGKLRKLLLAYARREGCTRGPIFRAPGGGPMDRRAIWAGMKALCRRAGVASSKVFPHNLRKLFARTFYAMEKDIAKLADLLGHSSIDTTRIYIISTGTEHRKKIERLDLLA